MQRQSPPVARIVGAQLVYWAPVWVPLVLLGQVALGGLRPALLEEERLAFEAKRVEERHHAARETYERKRAEVDAWQDPVYRERLRRVRSD